MTFIANSLWYLLCLPGSVAFQRALPHPKAAQRRYLLDLLRRNAETDFGRRYCFADIASVSEYQSRVPLATYRDYERDVARIGAGESNVLTQAPVLMLEPTSGSSAATKYIPYTASLKAEFQRAISPWIADLYRHNPGLLRGQAYWSVTPVTRSNERTPGGLPVGFEDDSQYFGTVQQFFIQRLMAVPAQVRLIDNMDSFRYVTLLFLLRSRNLALISVWNPTFLMLLMEPLVDWWSQLANDIEQGTLSPPTPLAHPLQTQLKALNKSDRDRAAEIRAAFQHYNRSGAIHTQLWPALHVISCWTEAHAALHTSQVAQLFPQAQIQAKGLLATEGVVSFPLTGYRGHVLAIRSHFFEFAPLDDISSQANLDLPLLAHQLQTNCLYEVILTTGGGLYRYRLRDVIRVSGYLNNCPLIQFVGKAGHISDRFGEKLNEYHVQQTLETMLKRFEFRPTFAMLAYEENDTAYTLFIEADSVSDQILDQLGHQLDIALQKNFHYRYCRDLGQLQPIRVFRIDGNGLNSYLAICQTQGQRAGDIKPIALHRMAGWSRHFQGKIVDRAEI